MKETLRKKIANKIFSRLQKATPNPYTELKYHNNYTLLVAIILSAQSTDLSVNKATLELFKIIKNPTDIIDLGLKRLKNYIKTIGLYNSKAKNIISMSEILVNQYNSEIPDNFEDLIKLPGVGRKTANVYLNTAHGLKVIAVDTHVFRVSNRLGLTTAKNSLESEKQLNEIVSKKYKGNAHNLLVLLGRYVCKAKKPHCHKCLVKDSCISYKQNSLDL